MFSIKRSPLSPKELEARRANARKSTGPRTPEGKVRVSFNRLLHGGRSARLEAFLRQRGTDPHAFLALRKSIRLPGEQVDPVQATVVKLWLKSPVQGGSMVGAGGFKTVIGDGHGQTRHQTVGSLLSAKKMASVMKGLSPDYNKILTGMVFEFVRSQLHGSSAVYRSKRVCHEKSTN